ncbi:hypothetical protein JR316_0013451 [Psilocybe cubensis]|uniref:Uncharacterized protein n=2 Tax=Psilocybe cubensis TaxID=181762 RepID=A0ACB8GF61_PSICU|nr:uncharacterized protein JR316_0013451 [Psilocybe cubensis]KAH9474288.1 hypothetical protein JR316_0013451 [Psilocybe cubensis]
MFAEGWYLRKERFVVYQIAMLTGLAAECTATYSLSKYQTLKHNFYVQSTILEPSSSTSAHLDQRSLNSSAISTIVFCVLVATLFGADFFFLVFWPERRYPKWYVRVKEVLAVIITAGVGASAIVSTWVVATHSAVISGVDHDTAASILRVYSRPPIVYRHWAQNIAWVVLLWIAFLSTLASTFLMFITAQHDARLGPESDLLSSKQERGLGTEEKVPIAAASTGTETGIGRRTTTGSPPSSIRDSTLSDVDENGGNIHKPDMDKDNGTKANATSAAEEANATRIAQGNSGHPTMALKHVQLPVKADSK